MKRRLTVIALVALSVLAPATGFADEELAPYTYVVSAPGGRYYFRMVRQKGSRDKGSGVVYAVGNDKNADRVQYTVSGWYAHQVFLSYNGLHLVRLGNWPRGRAPSPAHLAIAFYKKGKLVKRYSTAQLIKNHQNVQPSVSHYRYYRKIGGLDPGFGERFSITSVDGVNYLFDIRTGMILSAK